MPDLFELESEAVPAEAQVAAFRGVEGLSELYRFEVGFIVASGAEVDLDAGPSTRGSLRIHAGEERIQRVHGMLASLELVHAWRGSALYRAVLVPQLWQATLTRHSRVFVDEASPEFIAEVIEAAGIASDDFELRLSASYPSMPHVCQYEESDFRFVARWMEREGMYFYFEQGDEREKLVITDSASDHDPLRSEAVRYVPASGSDHMALEALNTLRCRRRMLPAEVRLEDYDYMNPPLDLERTEDVGGTGQVSRYGDNYRTTTDGGRLAEVRAQQIAATKKTFEGEGRVFELRPGYTFSVEEHPQPSLNETYLCTRLVHEANLQASADETKKLLGFDFDDEYRTHVEAIFAEVQYRHPFRTPIPRVEGVIHAVVDGPADSDYAQLDEEGRYKVRLFLDQTDPDDGSASTWVRMLQWHAGGTEGVHFPLRKGTEVLIIFLGGDPDRPMICGAAPNPQKPSPVTSNNHTWNVLQTGGGNYLAIQDASDKQYVDLFSPTKNTSLHLGKPHDDYLDEHTHNIVLETEGNCFFNIGGDQDIEVGGDLTEHVAGDVTETYDNDQDSFVGGDQTLEVGCDRDIEVGGDQTVEIGGDFDTEVGGDITLEGGGDYDTEISGDITFENGGDYDVEVSGDITFENGGDYDVEVGGDITFEGGGDYDVEVSGDMTFENGGDVSWDCGGNWKQMVAGKHSLQVGEKDFWTIGNSSKGTLGSTFSMFVGNKADIKIGNFADIALSNKFGLHVGSDIAISAALKLEVTGGVKVVANAATEVKLIGGPFVDTEPIKVSVPGFKVIS